MAEGQPTPPGQERPWYYQNWFLIAAFVMGWPVTFPFVLWPVWGVLILRSPWHSHTLIRGLAWAMLIVGAVLVVKNFRAPQGAWLGLAMIFPGLLVTVVTQVMWTRYRLETNAGGPPSNPPASPPGDSPSPSRRPQARRRANRRRGSRSGRSPR